MQIGSHIDAWNLDAPELFPFFEAAADLGAAILVHPWDMMGKESMPKYWLPWLVGMPAEQARAACCLIFGGVLERLPTLRVCFAHGGGAFPYTIGRIEHGFRMRPDLVATDNSRNPREYLDRLYFDSCVHDARALRYLLDVAGSAHVMLGTDYPFPLGEQHPGSGIAALDLSESEQKQLYHGTALEWLGLARFAVQLNIIAGGLMPHLRNVYIAAALLMRDRASDGGRQRQLLARRRLRQIHRPARLAGDPAENRRQSAVRRIPGERPRRYRHRRSDARERGHQTARRLQQFSGDGQRRHGQGQSR